MKKLQSAARWRWGPLPPYSMPTERRILGRPRRAPPAASPARLGPAPLGLHAAADGPKMAAALPTPPPRAPNRPWINPACWIQLPRAGPAVRLAIPRPLGAPGRARRCAHHGGGAAAAAARPRRAPTGKGRTRHRTSLRRCPSAI